MQHKFLLAEVWNQIQKTRLTKTVWGFRDRAGAVWVVNILQLIAQEHDMAMWYFVGLLVAASQEGLII